MQIIYERWCGLDVHKKMVTACVITPAGRRTRTFNTMTSGLLKLADWLLEEGVTHVAMESTGVYWKPVYNLLEGLEMEVLVVNAQRIKAVPGRKTDVKDAEWICELLQHGLMQGSYIPGRPQRELRELVRYRRSLIRERGQAINRIQKVLEGANIKLSSVASNVMGVSGRAMLEAMIAGTDDPKALAALARGRLRGKKEELEEALLGLVGPHQRLMLQSLLRHCDFLEGEVARLDEEIAARVRPFSDALQRLETIPGIGRRTAQEAVAEMGTDMSRFPSHRHLASWAGLCPGNNESAGKQRSGRTSRGNTWLRSALVEAGWAAAHTKNTYLSAQYRRLAARRGRKRAILALAHTILVTAYYLLRDETPYQDLGSNYFDERDHKAVTRRAVQRLQRLGYTVTLEAA